MALRLWCIFMRCLRSHLGFMLDPVSASNVRSYGGLLLWFVSPSVTVVRYSDWTLCSCLRPNIAFILHNFSFCLDVIRCIELALVIAFVGLLPLCSLLRSLSFARLVFRL